MTASIKRPKAGLTRRALMAGALALPATACSSGDRVTLRFKAIATVFVDGRLVEGSTVMEITYARISGSLLGNGGATRLYGEAMVLDLGDKGTVYILPMQHPGDNDLSRVYEYAVLATLGVRNSFGSLKDEDFAVLRSAKGRHPFKLNESTMLPAFVSFTDHRDPKTIFEVLPKDIGKHFPGVTFVGLDLQITDEPITKKLRDRLPWLSIWAPEKVFPRDPPGHWRPISKQPLSHKITRARFFGD